jgi:membrane-associated protein
MSYIMDLVDWLLSLLRNPGPHLATLGLWGMAAIIFVETGLLFPFLPGDSLLVVAGIYAAKGDLDLTLLLPVLIVAAIAGDAVSYYLGRKTGPKIFNRPRSRFFRPEYVEKAHAFYEKHGGAAIIIARFMPIVRTYVPVIAGIAQMPYRRFGFYNVIGGISWILSMSLLGYFLGDFAAARGFPLEKHIEKVIIIVVILSIAPGLLAWWKERRAAKQPAA